MVMNYVGISSEDFDDIYTLCFARIKTLIISLTHKCNFNCTHCLIGANFRNKHLMKTDYLKLVINQFSKISTARNIVFTGGEPFTRTDLIELVEYSTEHKIFVNIDTNGFLLCDSLIEKIASFKDYIRITISVDGLSSKTHDDFRRIKGAYNRILRNIKSLREADVPVTINTVLHKKNINEILGIIDFFVLELGCSHSLIPIISELGRGKTERAKKFALSQKQILLFLNKYYFVKFREFKTVKKDKLLDVVIPKPFIPSDIHRSPKCDWGFGMIGLTAKGRFGICQYANEELSTIKSNNNIIKAWHEDLFKTLRRIDTNNLKGVCGNCKYASWCRGFCRLYAHEIYKDIFAPYPFCQDTYNNNLFPSTCLINTKKESFFF